MQSRPAPIVTTNRRISEDASITVVATPHHTVQTDSEASGTPHSSVNTPMGSRGSPGLRRRKEGGEHSPTTPGLQSGWTKTNSGRNAAAGGTGTNNGPSSSLLPGADAYSAATVPPAEASLADKLHHYFIGSLFSSQSDTYNTRVRKTEIIICACYGLLQVIITVVMLGVRLGITTKNAPFGPPTGSKNVINVIALGLTLPMHLGMLVPYFVLRYSLEASDGLVCTSLGLALLSSTVEAIVEIWPSGPLPIAVIGVFAVISQMQTKSLLLALYAIVLVVYTTINPLIDYQFGVQSLTAGHGMPLMPRTVVMGIVLYWLINTFLIDIDVLIAELGRIGTRASQTADVAVVVAEGIAHYDTESVARFLAEYEGAESHDKRVLKSFRRINNNLRRYRPFLPNYLFDANQEVDSATNMDASLSNLSRTLTVHGTVSPTNNIRRGAPAQPRTDAFDSSFNTSLNHGRQQSSAKYAQEPLSPAMRQSPAGGGTVTHVELKDISSKRSRINEILQYVEQDDDDSDQDGVTLVRNSGAQRGSGGMQNHPHRPNDVDHDATSSTTEHATVNGLPSQSYWGQVTCCRVVIAPRSMSEASDSVTSLEDQYNFIVTKVQEIATQTVASLHSFIGDTLCATWNGTRRVVQGEVKASRFLINVKKALETVKPISSQMPTVNSGNPAFVFAGAIVTGMANCMFAGDDRQRTFVLSGAVFREPLDTILRKAVDVAVATGLPCLLCDYATNTVAKYRLSTRGAIAFGMNTRTDALALSSDQVFPPSTGGPRRASVAAVFAPTDHLTIRNPRASSSGRLVPPAGQQQGTISPTSSNGGAPQPAARRINTNFAITGSNVLPPSSSSAASVLTLRSPSRDNVFQQQPSGYPGGGSSTPPLPKAQSPSQTLAGVTEASAGTPPLLVLPDINLSSVIPEIDSADLIFEILDERAESGTEEWMYTLQASENASNEAVTDACQLLLRGDVAMAKHKLARVVDPGTRSAYLVRETEELIESTYNLILSQQQRENCGAGAAMEGGENSSSIQLLGVTPGHGAGMGAAGGLGVVTPNSVLGMSASSDGRSPSPVAASNGYVFT